MSCMFVQWVMFIFHTGTHNFFIYLSVWGSIKVLLFFHLSMAGVWSLCREEGWRGDMIHPSFLCSGFVFCQDKMHQASREQNMTLEKSNMQHHKTLEEVAITSERVLIWVTCKGQLWHRQISMIIFPHRKKKIFVQASGLLACLLKCLCLKRELEFEQ